MWRGVCMATPSIARGINHMEISDVGERESRLRSVLKAITYRIIGTLTTALIVFFVTGEVAFALTVGVAEPLAKIVIYYLHERAWQLVPRGTLRALLERGD